MKRRIIFILLVFLFSLPLVSQSSYDWDELKKVDPWYQADRPDYSEIDAYVKTIGYAAKTPEEIAKLCVKDCTRQIEKARAIYDWICFNIAYDTSYNVSNGRKTFTAKKAVCQGYAELFNIMAHAVNLNSKMITGIGKNIISGGHAWNVVCLTDSDRITRLS